MNTLTQQQINQYQWQVADGVARPVNPYENNDGDQDPLFKLYLDFEATIASYQLLAHHCPDYIYKGEAFDLVKEYMPYGSENWVVVDNVFLQKEMERNGVWSRQFLRLKPSHLPAVLTTQPGEEWKDRYKPLYEYYNAATDKWAECDETHGHPVYPTRTTWRLNTPPAEQEAETVEQAAGLAFFIDEEWAQIDKYVQYSKRHGFMRGAEWQLQRHQSTLTQKDQRIAELEQMVDQCQKNDLYFEQEKEQLNKRIAELERENKEMREHLNEIKAHGIIRPWI